jgi:hypothetical protein
MIFSYDCSLNENDLAHLYDDFNLDGNSFSNLECEKTELEFNFFENLLIFNQNTLNINEHINEDITDKLYFIGNKRKLEIENDFKKKKKTNTLLVKEINNIDDKMLEFKNIEKIMSMFEDKIIHNEFKFDNITNRLKNNLMKSFLIFINKKIEEKYELSEEMKDLKLYVLNNSLASNSNIKFNRDLITMTLKEIFSNKVSTKCKKVSQDQNKNAINNLLNDKDEERRNYFNKIFNLKFIDVLKYLRGETEGLEILEGLEFDKVCWNKIQKKENLLRYFTLLMSCYEKLWEERKPRNREKKKKENN